MRHTIAKQFDGFGRSSEQLCAESSSVLRSMAVQVVEGDGERFGGADFDRRRRRASGSVVVRPRGGPVRGGNCDISRDAGGLDSLSRTGRASGAVEVGDDCSISISPAASSVPGIKISPAANSPAMFRGASAGASRRPSSAGSSLLGVWRAEAADPPAATVLLAGVVWESLRLCRF